jgi:RHS repeat-associated protein
VLFAYDASGDLEKVSKQTGTGEFVFADAFSYAPHGQLQNVRFGNRKWETSKFNSRLQVMQVGVGHSVTDTGLWRANYDFGTWEGATLNTHRNNGSLARETITVPTIGTSSGFTAVQSYSYDLLDRLSSAAETISGVPTWKQAFAYDRFGNKNFDLSNTTIQSVQSTVAKITNPEILPSNNQFKKDQDGDSQPDYDYDSSGNLKRNAQGIDFTFNAENLQTTATGSGISFVYSYDGNNKRVKSYDAINNETTIFVYDADGDLAAEYTIGVEPPTIPAISYLTEDALGSIRLVTNSFGDIKSRRDFLPFGEELPSGIAGRNANQKYSSDNDDTRKKFATYQRDVETGLDFAQSRYYSPMHGRFTSPDEFKGGPEELFDFENDAADNPTFYADLTNPQSLNKYQYSYNNPYKYNDPTGHCPPCTAQVFLGPTVFETLPAWVRPAVIEPAIEVAKPLAPILPRIVSTAGTLGRGMTSNPLIAPLPTSQLFPQSRATAPPTPTTAQPGPAAPPSPELGKRARKSGRAKPTTQPKPKPEPATKGTEHTKGARRSTSDKHTKPRSGDKQPPGYRGKRKRPQDK